MEERIIALLNEIVDDIREGTSSLPCMIMSSKCKGCKYSHGTATCTLMMVAAAGEMVLEDYARSNSS